LKAAALLAAAALHADPAFTAKATALLEAGQFTEARQLAEAVLKTRPEDPDALVFGGTAVLYEGVDFRREESIYKPSADPRQEPEAYVAPELAREVAGYWKKVPALDPARSSLWGDLAQLLFRSGAGAEALDAAAQAVADPGAGPEALEAASTVFVLSLDWKRAGLAESRIPGSRAALLYQGLEAWRTGQDGWRTPLLDFARNPGSRPSGAQLAAYLAGPQMRDTEAGYQAAIDAEQTPASLAVRQKWTDRFPDQLRPRFELARFLSQYGSSGLAAIHFTELEKRGAAKTPAERESVSFQRAWALQASGQYGAAKAEWTDLLASREFYIRTAAAWFLGRDALQRGRPAEAKKIWTDRLALPPDPLDKAGRQPPQRYLPAAIEEPAGSKYATWAAEVYKTLK